MRIPLSSHFTYSKLIRFVFPSVMMMIFTSIYSIVDGFFVSNYVSTTAFSAVNLMAPIFIIVSSVGFMVGAGGTALTAKLLGEKRPDDANRVFSLMVYALIAGGILLTVASLFLLKPIAIALGAKGELLTLSIQYARIILVANTFFMLQNVFQNFLIAAEKPKFGLLITVIAGVTNMVLDFLFVGVFNWGVEGAAYATAMSQVLGGSIPLLYFAFPNNSLLRLTRTHFDGKALLKACTNGASELMTNVSASVVTMLYNFQLLRLTGEDGVAAYGVIMYVNFLFAAVFFGYCLGSAPAISFQYGASNKAELHNLFRKSMGIIGVIGLLMSVISFAMASPFSHLFIKNNADLYQMTVRGFQLYAFSFFLFGFNVFGSSFFTALNNGGVSATISFLRTLVFQVVCILVLPLWFGLDGVWVATLVAELLSLAVTLFCFFRYRKRYGY